MRLYQQLKLRKQIEKAGYTVETEECCHQDVYTKRKPRSRRPHIQKYFRTWADRIKENKFEQIWLKHYMFHIQVNGGWHKVWNKETWKEVRKEIKKNGQ